MRRLLFMLMLTITVSTASAQYAAVRVNALGLVTGTINIGVDIAIADKWSVDISAYWNPIDTPRLRAKTLAAAAGIRRWRFEPHIGLFWGAHTALAQYRVGNYSNRYNGYLAGLGSSIGYSWMLAKRWNITLEGGLGIFYIDDIQWKPHPSPYEDIYLNRYKRIVLTPSKIELSFSHLF